MKRGDVVIVEFPYVDGRRGKNRPALIVQNDRDNQRLTNTIVAMISGNIRHAGEPTQLLIDPGTPEGNSSGLHGVSVVKCNNLFTVDQQDILRHVGNLSQQLMQQVDQCLKVALELP
jgi:mRNA interferase MazF